MATLIPSLNTCLPRMTAGERRLARRLESKLEDDYLLWYDVPVGPRQLHPDFIVLHPGRGLLVLEVKDWRLDGIQRIDRQRVTLLGQRGVQEVVNPLEQARVYAQSLANLLRRDPALIAPAGHAHAGQLLLPWGYGVVLANISRRQFEASDLGEVLAPDRVICQDEMTEAVDPEAFQSRLWGMFTVRFPGLLSLPQIDRVRWHLFPEIRVAGQADLFSGDQVDDPDALPDLLQLMDLQQEQLARSLGEGHRIIHGVAGSGKTMILGFRCQHLARLTHKPILVLCYNKTLAARLQALLAGRELAGRVTVRSFHQWCHQQLHSYHVPAPPPQEDWFLAQVQAVIDAVERGHIPAAQYGAVLIDEGHDFRPEWLQLVTRMIDPVTNSLLLLYDDAQSIYQRQHSRRFSFRSLGIQAAGRTTILRLNYRNTAEVLAVAQRFAQALLSPAEADEDSIPLISPLSANRHGPRPRLWRLPNLAAEAAEVARQLQALHGQGLAWSDMAVLYPIRFIGEAALQALNRAGVPAELLGEAARDWPRRDRVRVVTLQSSKGLEFPAVAILGLGYLPHDRQPEIEQVRLLYVGLTRAMDHLLLTGHRASAFVQRLEQALQVA